MSSNPQPLPGAVEYSPFVPDLLGSNGGSNACAFLNPHLDTMSMIEAGADGAREVAPRQVFKALLVPGHPRIPEGRNWRRRYYGKDVPSINLGCLPTLLQGLLRASAIEAHSVHSFWWWRDLSFPLLPPPRRRPFTQAWLHHYLYTVPQGPC